MGAEVGATNVRVSGPVKRRLDQMQAEMQAHLGRMVTVSEVIETLIREHDKVIEAGPR